MNDALRAAIDSIAVELFRLGHAHTLPDDEDACAFEADLDLAAVVRVATSLSPHNIFIVSVLMCTLYHLQQREPERASRSAAAPH